MRSGYFDVILNGNIRATGQADQGIQETSSDHRTALSAELARPKWATK
jgi:hypothetical protein